MSATGDEGSPKTGNDGNWSGNGESKEGTPSPVSPAKRPANGIMATAEVVTNAYVASKGAHALVICTEWDEFKYDIFHSSSMIQAETVMPNFYVQL
jgi:hypothetical protein